MITIDTVTKQQLDALLEAARAAQTLLDRMSGGYHPQRASICDRCPACDLQTALCAVNEAMAVKP